jgi:hypothetical protein
VARFARHSAASTELYGLNLLVISDVGLLDEPEHVLSFVKAQQLDWRKLNSHSQ